MAKRQWPKWWTWELELTPHVYKRMLDRSFTEVDLRAMLERASDYHPDDIEGRWVIVSRHRQRTWEVIVEPDGDAELMIVVTAYSLQEET